MSKKIIFMGTPIFAAEILKHLLDTGQNIIAVVSQPDKKVGRKQEIVETPVKKVALAHGIDVIQPISIKTDFSQIVDLQPDLIITAAYGQIVPQEVLQAPRIDCINIHGSLLPKYRGGAPIHYAVLNGDEKTGVTIMEMVNKMDAGDIIAVKEFPILENDTTSIVHDNMIEIAKQLLDEKLADILAENYVKVPQDLDQVTFSPNITKEQEHVDFARPVQVVHNHIRGLSSWPGSYALLDDGRVKFSLSEKTKIDVKGLAPGTIRIIDNQLLVATTDYFIKLLTIQPAGKKQMPVTDWLRGIDIKDINDKKFQ